MTNYPKLRRAGVIRTFLHTRRGSWTGMVVGIVVAVVTFPSAMRFLFAPDDGDLHFFDSFVPNVVPLIIFGAGLGLLLGGVVNLAKMRSRAARGTGKDVDR
jgi:hypothetical protein